MATEAEAQGLGDENKIYVVGSSVEHARRVARAIIGTPAGTAEEERPSDLLLPWHISNKYYTADVGLALFDVSQLLGTEMKPPTVDVRASGVPAVVLVADKSKPISEFTKLTQTLERHIDPSSLEIALAIGLPFGTSPAEPSGSGRWSASAQGQDGGSIWLSSDEEKVAELLDEMGWEYVDGSKVGWSSTADEESEQSGLPGIERAREALQTYMWPNLVRVEPSSRRGGAARQEPQLDAIPVSSFAAEDGDLDLHDADLDSLGLAQMGAALQSLALNARVPRTSGGSLESGGRHLGPSTSASAALADNQQLRKSPSSGFRPPPEALARLEAFLEEQDDEQWEAITALAAREREERRRGTGGVEGDGWASGIRKRSDEMVATTCAVVPETGATEGSPRDGRSVASSIAPPRPLPHEGFEDDFADFISGPSTTASVPPSSKATQVGGDVESDALEISFDLPTDAEVLATHRQIFSSRPFRRPGDRRSRAAGDGNRDGEEEEGEDPDFDFSSALGALQRLTDEVRGMEDEGERRRAAARIALAFSLGLGDAGGDRLDQSDEVGGRDGP